MPLLNGKFVDASVIDPAKHKFIGTFRPATNPMADPHGYILCSCGEILQVRGQEVEHYRRGCCDELQYVDL
jgi:hypothetical protein